MNPEVRELVMLSALAALGCGLAAVQGDLLFVAIFGAACALTIIEAIRRCSEIIGCAESRSVTYRPRPAGRGGYCRPRPGLDAIIAARLCKNVTVTKSYNDVVMKAHIAA